MAADNKTSFRRPKVAWHDVAVICALSLAGCASLPTHPPVPPVKAELVPKPPRSQTTLIWQPGHWSWTGTDYVWIDGVWTKRAGHGTLWQDGFWQETAGRVEWVEAHWL